MIRYCLLIKFHFTASVAKNATVRNFRITESFDEMIRKLNDV